MFFFVFVFFLNLETKQFDIFSYRERKDSQNKGDSAKPLIRYKFTR